MTKIIPPPADAVAATYCTAEDYDRLYRQSVEQPDAFWAEQAKRIDWDRVPTRNADWSFDPVEIKWFEDGVLNLCHNCVDRHLPARSAETALVWEADAPGEVRSLTYGALHAEVVRMANCLKAMSRRSARGICANSLANASRHKRKQISLGRSRSQRLSRRNRSSKKRAASPRKQNPKS